MEKIPVNIIISKNKALLSPQCDLWYIPYCPIDIKDVDDWYDKTSRFIDTHYAEYNILHIPNSIYNHIECENSEKNQKVNIMARHLFIVGIGNTNTTNKLITLTNNVPDGYHMAYCLQRNTTVYDPYEKNVCSNLMNASYDYVVRVWFYIFYLFVTLILCTFIFG